MSKLEKKIKLLGINYDARVFNILRTILAIILFLYLVFSIKVGYIIAPIVAILFYVLCEYVIIDLPLKKKNIETEKEGIDYVSALLLNLKNGKSVKTSIKNSSRVIKGNLSKEFAKVLSDIKIGLTIDEALNDLCEKVPSIYIQNIIIDLKENTKYGTKILDSVEWQLEAMEQHYEETVIGKKKMLPIKLCLNTILFLALMIILLLYYIY